jgi:hypothetical protein
MQLEAMSLKGFSAEGLTRITSFLEVAYRIKVKAVFSVYRI